MFSGIGNAYSDEILHRARLSPFLNTDRALSRLLKKSWPRSLDELDE